MGQIMVNRYRPMRLVPTMTTREVIYPRLLFCVEAQTMTGRQGRQQANPSKMPVFRHFLALKGRVATFLKRRIPEM
ncbi:hypothetical protein C6W91_14665 [Phaeobacter sp. SYSU ZJ3003]